jgi:hypothetical protein
MDSESSPEGGQEPVRLPDTDARMKEISRIAAEIEEVNRKIAAERALQPTVEDAEEDPEFLEFGNEMSGEEQAEWMQNLRSRLQEHRDDIARIPGGVVLLQRLDDMTKHKEILARLEDETQDVILQTYADEADIATRLSMAKIEMMRYLENLTDDQWQEMPPEKRGNAVDLLNQWNSGEREEILSQLPIEIRRRYE